MRRPGALACLTAFALFASACGSNGEAELAVLTEPVQAEEPPEPAALSETVVDVDDVLTPTFSDVADATPLPPLSDLLELPPRPLPTELTALDDVDVEAVLRRGCLMWSFDEFRDSGAINDAVNSFLTSADTFGADGSRTFTRRQLDRFASDGIRAACAADTAEHAWGILAGTLDMSDEDFALLVGQACGEYRAAEAQPAQFRPRDKTWDGFILQVLGVGDLTDLIDALCGPAG